MAYATVDFDDGEPYVGNRAVETVTLYGPGGSHGTSWSTLAIVDTGADYMHLPTEGATAVGISLAGASSSRFATAGGCVTMNQLDVDVAFHGARAHVPVNFAPGTLPVIGRQAIFTVVEAAGFTTTEWLLDWWQQQQPSQPAPASPARTAPDDAAAPRIVDYGTWLEIAGVRVDKRRLRDALLGDVVAP